MKLTIEIKLDNAAFECDEPHSDGANACEVVNILNWLTKEIDGLELVHGTDKVLFDSSGEPVGKMRVTGRRV